MSRLSTGRSGWWRRWRCSSPSTSTGGTATADTCLTALDGRLGALVPAGLRGQVWQGRARALRWVISAVVVLTAVGSIWIVVLTEDSGAHVVWG